MQNQQIYLEEVSLSELLQSLYKSKFTLIFITTLFAVSSVLIAINIPNLYRSETKLIASSESTSNLSSLAGGLGGLASMAGLSLGSESGEKSLIAREMLKSRKFLSKFVEKSGILVPLIAAEGVDEQGNLLINEKLYNTQTKEWIRDVVPPKPVVPASEDIYFAFQEYLIVDHDKKSGITTVSFEFYRADIAQQWLSWLIEDLNREIKVNDMVEAKASITYLTGLIDKNENAALKEAFYQLVEEQTKTLLLTEVRDEYVHRAIDPATFPEEKSSPQRALICIVMTIVGGIIAVAWVLIRYFISKGRTKKTFDIIEENSGVIPSK